MKDLLYFFAGGVVVIVWAALIAWLESRARGQHGD